MNLTLLAVSILPVVLLLLYIYRKDKNEREPAKLLIKSFFAGVAVAIIILVVFDILDYIGIPTEFKNPVLKAFINAAIPEEGLKFLFLFLIVWKNRHFNEYFDGIVYAVFVSMGFACLENILYVTNGGLEVGIMRAFISVPAHFFFATFMGFYLSKAKFNRKNRKSDLFLALFIPILIHGIFDTILMTTEVNETLAGILIFVFFVFDFIIFRIAIKRINRYCHICGRKINKGQTNCPYCQEYLDNYNANKEE